MTIADVARFVRTNFLFLLVLSSAGLAFSFLHSLRQPVIYAATSTGYVVADTQAISTTSALALTMAKLPQYQSVVGSAPVAKLVTESLGLDVPPSSIASRFSAVASPSSPMLTITAAGTSPQEAQDLANAVIDATAEEVRRLDTAGRPQGASRQTDVTLITQSPAQLPTTPVSPDYFRSMGAGFVVGGVVAVGILLLRRQLDARIRTTEQVESLGFNVLSVVPRDEDLNRVSGHGLLEGHVGPVAEAFRRLRTNLRFADVDNPPRSIVVTSANAGDGKTAVASNLAHVLAASGQPTVLIDADLRRPVIASLLDADREVGLTQALSGDVPLEMALQDVQVDHLRVLTSGRTPPNPSELLGSRKMAALLQELTDAGNIVVIDAPPLLPVADAGILAGTADGVLLVLSIGETFEEEARLASKYLDQVGGRVLGAVLNKVHPGSFGSVIYGYGYDHHSKSYDDAYAYRGVRSAGTRREQRRMQGHETASDSSLVTRQ